MAEDGAWAVPPIRNKRGEILKQNNAPELFIKYIAHDIQCHIIIVDLSLKRIQFCSANHLKDNNVKFDSPLLLYTTGGHFQAVHQRDHAYFIQLANELETGQTVANFAPSVSFECLHYNENVVTSEISHGSVVNRPYTVSGDKSRKKNPSHPSAMNIVDPSTMPEDGPATTNLPIYPPTHLATYPHLPTYPTHQPTYPPTLRSNEDTLKTCPHIL